MVVVTVGGERLRVGGLRRRRLSSGLGLVLRARVGVIMRILRLGRRRGRGGAARRFIRGRRRPGMLVVGGGAFMSSRRRKSLESFFLSCLGDAFSAAAAAASSSSTNGGRLSSLSSRGWKIEDGNLDVFFLPCFFFCGIACGKESTVQFTCSKIMSRRLMSWLGMEEQLIHSLGFLLLSVIWSQDALGFHFALGSSERVIKGSGIYEVENGKSEVGWESVFSLLFGTSYGLCNDR